MHLGELQKNPPTSSLRAQSFYVVPPHSEYYEKGHQNEALDGDQDQEHISVIEPALSRKG